MIRLGVGVLYAVSGVVFLGCAADVDSSEAAASAHAVSGINACDAADLRFSEGDAGVCSGPWSYVRYRSCEVERSSLADGESCRYPRGPLTCPPDQVSKDWNWQKTTQADVKHYVTYPNQKIGDVTERHCQLWGNTNSIRENGGIIYTRPDAGVRYSTMPTIDWSFTPTSLRQYISVKSTKLTTRFVSAGGRSSGSSRLNLKRAPACEIVVSQPVPEAGPGCFVPLEQPRCYLSQDARCGLESEAQYSAPGLTAAQAAGPREVAGLTCTTCQDQAYVDANFDGETRSARQMNCLSRTLRRLSDRQHQAAVVAQMQRVYEHGGDELSYGGRGSARSRYADGATLGCGPEGYLPGAAACSPFPVHTANFRACARLGNEHVSDALAAMEFAECANAVSDLVGRFDGCSEANIAESRALLRAYMPKLDAVLSKALRHRTDADTDATHYGRKLSLLSMWWRAASDAEASLHADPPGSARSALEGRLAEWWAALGVSGGFDELAADIDAGKSPSTIAATIDALGEARAQRLDVAIEATRVISSAAWANLQQSTMVTNEEPVAKGAVWLLIAGDALSSFMAQAERLVPVHNLACAVAECDAGLQTPLLGFYRAVASLGENAVPLVADDVGPSRALFLSIREQSQAFLRALSEPDAARGRELIQGQVAIAEQRLTSFALTGQLDGYVPNTLRDGMNKGNRERIEDEVLTALQRFSSESAQYRSDLRDLAQTVLTQMDAAAGTARLQNSKLIAAKQYDDLAQQRSGMIYLGETDDRRFDDLNGELEKISDVLDRGANVVVYESPVLDITGAVSGAKPGATAATVGSMSNWRSDEALGRPITAGEVLVVNAAGLYSPTCAMQERPALTPDGGRAPLGAPDAQIGPEGFSIQYSNGTFDTFSRSEADTMGRTQSLAASAQICVGAAAYGNSAQACVTATDEVSKSNTKTTSTSQGGEASQTVAMSGGHKQANTPFPNAAAGALLVALVDAASGDLLDVRPVNGPSSSIAIGQPTHAYLVVNDLGCGENVNGALNVRIQVTQNELNAARTVVTAMGRVQQLLRAKISGYLQQRIIFPSDQAADASEARQALQVELNGDGIRIEDVPPPVTTLFEAFLAKEQARTARVVEIARVEREMELALDELIGLDQDIRAAQGKSRLTEMLSSWTLQSLEAEHVQSRMTELSETVRDYLMPTVAIWYPALFNALSHDEAATTLASLPVDASLRVVSSDVASLLEGITDALKRASLGHKLEGELPLVAVSLPRPGAIADGYQLSAYPKLDDVASRKFWDSVMAGESAELQIRPEDIYSSDGLTFAQQLSCNEVAPVIRRMGLVFARPNQPDHDVRNGNRRWIKAAAYVSQPFALEDGPLSYHLASGEYDDFDVTVVSSEPDAAVRAFTEHGGWAHPVGLSPFGGMTLDFSAITKSPDMAGLVNDFGDNVASEIIVVMELDTRYSAEPLSWVTSCR